MDIARPILSVSRLQSQGFSVVFTWRAFLEKDGIRLPLVRHNGLFFLPTVLPGAQGAVKQVPNLSVLAKAQQLADQLMFGSRRLKLYEYGGEGGDTLRNWFAQRGMPAVRLARPQFDLCRADVVNGIF